MGAKLHRRDLVMADWSRGKTLSNPPQALIKEFVMNKAINYLAFIFCITLSVSLAQAEPEAHDMQEAMHYQRMSGDQNHDRYFKEMDANGDGTISKAEFDSAHSKHFQDMDTNGDSNLTREEMRAGHKQIREKVKDKFFDEADVNHDGALSRDEAKKMPRILKRFDKIDSDKDGKLTREELEVAKEKKRSNSN